MSLKDDIRLVTGAETVEITGLEGAFAVKVSWSHGTKTVEVPQADFYVILQATGADRFELIRRFGL